MVGLLLSHACKTHAFLSIARVILIPRHFALFFELDAYEYIYEEGAHVNLFLFPKKHMSTLREGPSLE